MINSWEGKHGIGVQSGTTYFRTDNHFAWYRGGIHDGSFLNPGGGTVQMAIDNNDNVGIGTAAPSAKLDVRGKTKSQELEVNGSFTVATGQKVQGIPIIDFKRLSWNFSVTIDTTEESNDNFYHERQVVECSFAHVVKQAEVASAGSHMSINHNFHIIAPIPIPIDTGVKVSEVKIVDDKTVKVYLDCYYRYYVACSKTYRALPPIGLPTGFDYDIDFYGEILIIAKMESSY